MRIYIIYGIYNLIYELFSLGFLFYANTYLNDSFIPNNLKWQDGKPKEDLTGMAVAQTIILTVEATLLMMLMYYINRRFLTSIAKANNTSTIAACTAGGYATITLTFIGWLMYSIFK